MFDNVGKSTEPTGRRRLGALALSLLLNGGVAAGLVWAGSRVVEEVIVEDEPIEVAFRLVAPPPPPPLGGSPSAAKQARKRAPLTPREVAPDEVVTPLDEVPPAESESDGGADAGGDPGGAPGGVPGGEGDGPPGGELGAPPLKTVHWTELQVKTRATARFEDYPEAARALDLPETKCVVRLIVDAKGRVIDVMPKKCPELFHAAAKRVGARYAFYPYRDAGQGASVQFDLTLNFKPSD